MKSIHFILKSISLMRELQIPAQIEIGTFKVKSTGSLINWAGRNGEFDFAEISFNIEFRPDHIQGLIEMGVKFDFQNVKMANLSEKALRFKSGREAINQGRYAPYYYGGNPDNHQTGVIENWLTTTATCTVNTLEKLDRICRENHRNQIAIHNDTTLRAASWKFKENYSSHVPIESQYFNIKAIRKTTAGKKANELLPIQKRVIKLK